MDHNDREEIQDYQSTIKTVIFAMRFIRTYDIPGLLDQIARADAIGCFIDPTLYREKAQAMREDRELLEAALPMWKFSKRLEANERKDP